jgi:uncharacterized protein YacL
MALITQRASLGYAICALLALFLIGLLKAPQRLWLPALIVASIMVVIAPVLNDFAATLIEKKQACRREYALAGNAGCFWRD